MNKQLFEDLLPSDEEQLGGGSIGGAGASVIIYEEGGGFTVHGGGSAPRANPDSGENANPNSADQNRATTGNIEVNAGIFRF